MAARNLERIVKFKAWAGRKAGNIRLVRQDGWPQMPEIAAWKGYHRSAYPPAIPVRVEVTVRVIERKAR